MIRLRISLALIITTSFLSGCATAKPAKHTPSQRPGVGAPRVSGGQEDDGSVRLRP